MNSFHVFPVLFCAVLCAPSLRIIPDNLRPPQLLTLPSNATSIRNDISDSFSCEGRSYGYYADVENDCQLFHVCLPMKYQDGRTQMFRWSFICPEETVFNQELFTCTRSDESIIDCAESPRFYDLNRNFGSAEVEATGTESSSGLEEEPQEVPIEVMQSIGRTKYRKD
ncbi:U-scoloptoxin(01)-Cw1a [Dendroctonus ponderosae]|uniref:Chitin-binding type-2 domain-containing protein n=1 Tax=Dendroctonus ponderosae TaxID=77166 RepID=U4UG90_DENPD|nr:U-scoloptoxin(01)-Cw1a [Dendroctonus ponderosae]ERL88910.1 hypothetical protein D910_06289 [Dendroctonus ponderosae]KAH1014890.1 hypothetical protein HUJ05_012700 [Dendroctonus ponderosae]